MSLHDHLQQLLVGLKLRLRRCRRAGAADDVLKQTLVKMNELVDESLSSTRQLVMELSPPILQQGDLKAAMQWLVEWMQDKHELQVKLEIEEGADVQSKALRGFLLQAVRELLFNVVKHASVKTASLVINRQNNYLWLSVNRLGRGVRLESGGQDRWHRLWPGEHSRSDRVDGRLPGLAVPAGQGRDT